MRFELGLLLLPALALACSSSPAASTATDSGSADDAADDGGDDAGDDAPPEHKPCAYPSGKPGEMVGYVVPKWLQWQGYVAGSKQVTTIKITDYYDGDGAKGINAIVIDESATWCGPCNQEAPVIEAAMEGTWGKDGVRVLTLMVENAQHQKADVSTAFDWIGAHNLLKIDVAADPIYTFSNFQGTNGLPTNVLVDPRTMKILNITPGFSGQADPAVEQLAQKNKGITGTCPP